MTISPRPKRLLERQIAGLHRKKRAWRGEIGGLRRYLKKVTPAELLEDLFRALAQSPEFTGFTVVASRTPREIERFKQELLEGHPVEARIRHASKLGVREPRLVLTHVGRFRHTLFHPFPNPWNDLSAAQQRRIEKTFLNVGNAYVRQKRRQGIGVSLEDYWRDERNAATAVASRIRGAVEIAIEEKAINPSTQKKVLQYAQGWDNLSTILQGLIQRINARHTISGHLVTVMFDPVSTVWSKQPIEERRKAIDFYIGAAKVEAERRQSSLQMFAARKIGITWRGVLQQQIQKAIQRAKVLERKAQSQKNSRTQLQRQAREFRNLADTLSHVINEEKK